MYLRVVKGSLQPADQCAAEELRQRGYKVGDILAADLSKLRNPKFNRLVHRIGQLCARNIDEFHGIDAHLVIKRLQIEGKIECDEIGILFPGYGMVGQFIPRSLSFDSMDEGEFNKAARSICRLISERYWKNLSPEQIEEMAGSMVDEV